MTLEILATTLDRLGELSVFPRTSRGPIPCVFLDAHNTCLQVPYLVRVNPRIIDDDLLWMSNSGLPNGTAVWQLGDLSKQHGSCKMAMTREKDVLVLYTQRMEVDIAIQQCDMISLIHRMVAPSFRQVESNIKALQIRGWFECNSVLMDHLDVQRNTERMEVAEGIVASTAALETPTALAAVGPEFSELSTPSVVAPAVVAPRVAALDILDLNVMKGVAGTCTQDLPQHFVCNEAVHHVYMQQNKDGAKAR